MTSPDLILIPFAQSGNQATPPQTDPSNFVNFTGGYTPDYEILLTSGNPRAKGVERPIQNYLFYQAQLHAQNWQQMSYAPWFNTMPGGYAQNAVVIRYNGTIWVPYRSLVSANVTDPLSAPASWAYMPAPSEVIANIPMPQGGVGGSSAALITVATDFNTLGTGTYEIQSDAIASGSAHSPGALGGSAVAGMLESMAWLNGATTYTVQRYLDRNGFTFTRFAVNAAWSSWTNSALVSQIQNGSLTYAVAGGTANALTVTLSPSPGAYTDGMIIALKASATNTAPFTINVNGIGAVAAAGPQGAFIAGEVATGGNYLFMYNSTGPKFTMIGQGAGADQLAAGTYGVAPPASDNTTKVPTTSWIWTNIQALVASTIGAVATAAGFAISLTSNGYIKLPSWLGGWIAQWGTATSSGTLANNVTASFALTYPTATRWGVCGINGAQVSGSYTVQLGAFTTTTLTATASLGGAAATAIVITYFTIGN